MHTRAVAAGRPTEPGTPVNQPIVLASNFRDVDNYVRGEGTDSWRAFEAAMGALEGGESIAFSSGMAAVAAVVMAFAAKVIVVPAASYQGVRSLLADFGPGWGVEVRMVDITDTEAVLAAAHGPDGLSPADLVWLESPTNPMLDIADLPALLSALATSGIATVVDATFATPCLLRPLELGATLAMHSATKFIGGHSDLLMGVLSTKDAGVAERVRLTRTLHGAIPGALETFLALRGLRTMPLRVERSQDTAGLLATRLAAHPGVETVLYPGLVDHPGHARAAADLDGFGAMLSFIVTGGAAAADALCAAVRLITHATSLGGVESTLERRQKYAGEAHLPPGLIRLSVGIEDPEDLWHDLCRALAPN